MPKVVKFSAHPTTAASRPAKRQRTGPAFGARTEDDDPRRNAENNPSSAALSIRNAPVLSIPTLTTLCARSCARNFRRLSEEDSDVWKVTRMWLTALPDSILSRLFSMLGTTDPYSLTHPIIAAYFLRGNSVILNGSMGLTSETLSAISRYTGKTLQTLVITDCTRFSDAAFASLFKRLPSMRVVNLRNCSKVGPQTVEAIAKHCGLLQSINLNNTSVTATSLSPLILDCLELEVLKLAGVQNISDVTIAKLISLTFGDVDDLDDIPLKKLRSLKHLRSLKLRHCNVAEPSISHLTKHCLGMERLDVSFTQLHHMPTFADPSSLVKLALTSTYVPGRELVDFVRRTPKLKTLNIGAMGVKPGSSSTLMSTAAMTLNDETLFNLTDALMSCSDIESINLVQNAKLGAMGGRNSALAFFVRHVGRKCKSLNLSGIPGLRSGDLEGLLAEGNDPPPRLTNFILNKTNVDDDAVPWISCCIALETLEVAETKLSSDGLFSILDECDRLSKLNLTGCRSVNIRDRRRFFEVWKEERRNALNH